MCAIKLSKKEGMGLDTWKLGEARKLGNLVAVTYAL
jgi:hypothetical protein